MRGEKNWRGQRSERKRADRGGERRNKKATHTERAEDEGGRRTERGRRRMTEERKNRYHEQSEIGQAGKQEREQEREREK